MITIITGTPGAGKTLYTIEKLLLPLVGTTVTYTDSSGQEVTAPRTIYTNINGLLVDHELIDGGDTNGLRDWHIWAKPGAVIVFDEVQRHWIPRANGSKVPDDIQALETHRHMGVDFIIITQNVLLVDRNIHALAGRHLHVRRLAATHMAIVYEWDHVSRGLLYAKSLNKSPWRYSKKVFKLYKSAEAHTKQKRAIPGLVWFVLVAILGFGFLAPTTYARLTERIGGQAAQDAKKTPASGIGVKTQPVPSPTPQTPASGPEQAPPSPSTTSSAPAPVFSGCAAIRGRCSCYDTQGTSYPQEPGFCYLHTSPPPIVLAGGRVIEHQTPAPAPARLPFVADAAPTGGGLEELRTAVRNRYGAAPRP